MAYQASDRDLVWRNDDGGPEAADLIDPARVQRFAGGPGSTGSDCDTGLYGGHMVLSAELLATIGYASLKSYLWRPTDVSCERSDSTTEG